LEHSEFQTAENARRNCLLLRGDHRVQINFVYFPDYMDYFLLDPKTGELRTAKPLDKEALDDSTGVINITVRVGKVL